MTKSISGITAVGMLILRQPDIPAAVQFYQKLGLRLKFQLQDKWAEMMAGNMKIGLCPTSQATEYRTGIVFQVEDLQAFYDVHKEQVHFYGEPQEAVHGKMLSFKDPGGNISDLYQPTPERIAELVRQAAEEGALAETADVSNGCQKTEKNDDQQRAQKCCKNTYC